LAKEAGRGEDAFARASYLEGVLGRTPLSLARNAEKNLAQLLGDLEGEVDNRIIETLRYQKGVSEKDLRKLFGKADLKLFEALKAGAKAGMGGGVVRGLSAEDVAMAIASGMSPLTGGPLRYGKGKNVFYHLGKSAGNKITIGGLATILKAEAKNRAIDIVRGAAKGELDAADIDAPAYRDDEGDGSMTIGEMIEAPSQYRADYVDLLYAIFNDRSIVGIIDKEIAPLLRGEVQRQIWNEIKANPDLLNLRQGKVTVRNKELAQALGSGTSPQAAGKLFNQKVWPVIELALTDSSVTKKLLKNRQILQIIQEAQQNRGRDKSRTRGIGISGLPDPQSGPGRRPHGPFQQRKRFQGPQPYPGSGIKRLPKFSSHRVVSKYLEYVSDREKEEEEEEAKQGYQGPSPLMKHFNKKSWRLPAKDARLYKKMKDWAMTNWSTFADSRGKVNFDGLATALARRFGEPWMADEPAHYVWEISYDVGRMKP